MNRSNFPTRFSPEEIEANRSKIPAYVVLPIPTHATQLQFESIGRTTFKKYVLKAYENLFVQDAFPIADYWNTPFIVSPEAKVPHIVHTQTDLRIQVNPQAPPKAKALAQNLVPIKTTPQPQPKKQPQQPQQQQQQPQPQTQPQKSPEVQAAATMNQPDDFSIDGGYYAPPHRKYLIVRAEENINAQ